MIARMTCFALLTSLIAPIAATSHAADADQKKAQALVDRAIEAQGGIESARKLTRFTAEDRGTFYGMGQAVPYEGRYAMDIPRRSSLEIVNVFKLVVDGDKGQMIVQGNSVPLDEDAIKEHKLQSQSYYVATLIPIAKPGKDYRLQLFGTETVDGEECDGINVERDGYRTVTLLFSRKTGLVKKYITVVRDDQTGKEVTEETIHSDFRQSDAGLIPFRVAVFRDGKKYVESETTQIDFPEKLDDALFKQE